LKNPDQSTPKFLNLLGKREPEVYGKARLLEGLFLEELKTNFQPVENFITFKVM